MGEILGLAAVAAVAAVAVYRAFERGRARLDAWRRAASGAGLEDIEQRTGDAFAAPVLSGRTGELRMRLEGLRREDGGPGTRIVLTGSEDGGLTVRRRRLSTVVGMQVRGEREIAIGVPRFDEEFSIQGDPALALALLDGETRTLLARLLRGELYAEDRPDVRASLAYGVIRVDIREGFFSDPIEKVEAALEAALDIGRRLVPPPDLASRIAENVRAESHAGARLQGLLLLARQFPDHPVTREALLSGREDPSEEVRLQAATALGREGRPTLVDLVSDARTADMVAARAITALGFGLSDELAEATLRRALAESGRGETARACLEVLRRRERSAAEGLLIEALRSPDARVQLEAARTLGRVGSPAAVVPLREAADLGGELRFGARHAIAEIQARLKGASPGQLSLAGGEAGQLSLAEGEEGDLSLAGEASQATADPSGPGRTGVPRDDGVKE